ncbi:MAG: hypothetical protein ACKPKO_37210, partial [Candidatus Fonsibacter sp.]
MFGIDDDGVVPLMPGRSVVREETLPNDHPAVEVAVGEVADTDAPDLPDELWERGPNLAGAAPFCVQCSTAGGV